jgi:hypothetical protein
LQKIVKEIDVASFLLQISAKTLETNTFKYRDEMKGSVDMKINALENVGRLL